MRKMMMVFGGLMVMLLAVTSHAALITGGISFGSAGVYTLTGGTTLSTNTGFDFAPTNNAIVSSKSGDFSTIPFGTGALFHDFTFDPSSSLSGQILWDFTYLGKTYALTMDSGAIAGTRSDSFLNIQGAGTLTATGFIPTPGFWTFTATSSGGELGFASSASASVVPEPGTMLLLGSGLVGLAGWGRKKFRK